MSNGAACCALEICCNSAAQKRKVFTEKLVKKTGDGVEECEKYAGALLDILEEEDLVFAPAQFQATIDELVRIARAHRVNEH